MTLHLGEFKTGADWALGVCTITDDDVAVDLTASGVSVVCQLKPHEFSADVIDVDVAVTSGGVATLTVDWTDTDVSAGTWMGDVLVELSGPSRRISATFEITVVANVSTLVVAP